MVKLGMWLVAIRSGSAELNYKTIVYSILPAPRRCCTLGGYIAERAKSRSG
jgi:hypothetical protein